jgi:pyroglutamyl-peptidase
MASATRTESLIVTGFEPFGPHAINPSNAIAEACGVLGEAAFGCPVVTATLPVTWLGGPQTLSELLAQVLTPDNAQARLVMFGVSRTPAFRVELCAHNRSYANDDNAGLRWVSVGHGKVIEGAPDHLAARLDAAATAAIDRLCADGLAQRSHHAGAYLCNHSYYRALHTFGDRLALCVFVHTPPASDEWPLARIVETGVVIARALSTSAAD